MSPKGIGNCFRPEIIPLFIEYNRNDLISKLQVIETDLLEFYKHSLEKVLCMTDENLKEMLFLKYCKWFNLKVS